MSKMKTTTLLLLYSLLALTALAAVGRASRALDDTHGPDDEQDNDRDDDHHHHATRLEDDLDDRLEDDHDSPEEEDDDDADAGWSEWSDWSLCSRTCDGGAAVQTRRCRHYTGCRGDSVRYKLCNVKPCPEGSRDFRAVQCSEYDGLPHEGVLYQWRPAQGTDPCALTCQAGQGEGPVVTLNPRVQDGTRCAPDSLDLCINGRCQKVGCDLRLGSDAVVDQCGVCGGDGTTCNKPSYYWDKRANGPCSASCGGGYQMLSAVCVERSSGRRSAEALCDHTARPIPVILNCNDHACPTSWQTGAWGACSVSCGQGYQLREVYCSEPRNTTWVRVADHYCGSPRPRHRQPCNDQDCFRWYDGIWSQCSVTCGDGVQTRVVLCRDVSGRSSRLCDAGQRPPDTRSCRTGAPCPLPATLAHPRHQPFTPAWWSEEQDVLGSEEGVAPLMPRPQALTADQQVPAEPTYMKGNWSSCSVSCGEGMRTRSVTCKIFLEFSRTVAELPDSQCPTVKPPHTQRCVLPPCSHAMIKHEYPAGEASDAAQEPPIVSLEDAHDDSNIDHKIHETPFLPRLVNEDLDSGGGKNYDHDSDLPVPQAQAYNEPHPGLHSYEAPGDLRPPSDPLLLYTGEIDGHDQYDSYEMNHGKSPSSQHSEMNSIEINMGGDDEEYPGSYHITEVSKIAHIYQWTTLGFGPCSASCLGGVQESEVHCIRISDKELVKPKLCSTQDRPDIITRTCNDQPCPPRWNISEFGECSKPCGGGTQTREVKCIHEVTRGGTNTVEVPDSLCPQPPHRRQQHCNFMDCPPEWVPGRWSKCSAPCGGGIKRREVKCQQTMAQGQIEERLSRDCPSHQPRTFRKCNRRECQEEEESRNSVIKSQVYQNYVQSKFMKKFTLKVGGKATVFRGVKLKIKCPVRRFDRSKITWWFEGRQVGRRGPIRTTTRGVLKIKEVQYPHAGVYICKANKSEANITLVVEPLPSSYSSSEELHPPSGSLANEVSLHTHEDATGTYHSYDWLSNKSNKLRGSADHRRKGRMRIKSTKTKGRRGHHQKNNWDNDWPKNINKTSWTLHTTLRPMQPVPTSPGADTLGEGPFKASSKNMHTVEVTSSEATNTYDPTSWYSNTHTRTPEQEYVYGTAKHTGWPLHSEKGYHRESELDRESDLIYESTNHLPEKSIGEEKKQVYGTISHHSDGSRITSEETHVYGIIRHGRLPDATDTKDAITRWSDTPPAPETHLPERNPVFKENGNSIEDVVNGLDTKTNFSPDDTGSESEHRNPPFHWSGQRLGSWSGHGESQSSNYNTGQWPSHGTSPTWGSSTSSTSDIPQSWHSWTNSQDQHQQYDHPAIPHWHNEASPYLPSAPPNTSSGGSRSVPYFQKLLSNLESFLPTSLQRTISSRGGRHASSPVDEFGGMISHDLVRDATTTEHPLGTPEILGKGTRDSLEFEWQMTNWSECSQTCGFTSTSSGYQVRSIQCLVRVNNVSRPVDGALCVDAGLEAPVTIQRCGLTECPQWHFGEWSECESSRCFTLHYAYQRRDVVCQLHNGTVVSSSQCDERTRPRHRQECYNYQCSGVWRVGDWSECTAPCGGQGYRTRLLQCVWNGTKKAAGNACRELPRPEVVRWCDGEPCPDLSEEETKALRECRDRSKYCSIVKRLNMCRIQIYREQCCRSCP